MKILVACEESQEVTKAFRSKGHEAYSCDIQECSGGHPEWHIVEDALLIANTFRFYTQDRIEHFVNEWDMIIAFPPCTDLSKVGARFFPEKIANGSQQKAVDFFLSFTELDCPKVVIENPVGIMTKRYRKWDQIIQPWQFGHHVSKATCLWLKGVPKLLPTDIVDKGESVLMKDGRPVSKWYSDSFSLPKEERAKYRSKTFPGIAKAMADQWG